MEAALVELYDVIRKSSGGPMMRARKAGGVENCYVGEEVLVEVRLCNPLRAQLTLADLSLVCKLKNDEGAVPASAGFAVEQRQCLPQSAGEFHDTSTDIANLTDGPIDCALCRRWRETCPSMGFSGINELPCEHHFSIEHPSQQDKQQRRRYS